MKDDQQADIKFLEDLLKWCKERDRILEEIEIKLHEMKRIAEFALDNELTSIEIEELNRQLDELKREVHSLEEQLNSVVH